MPVANLRGAVVAAEELLCDLDIVHLPVDVFAVAEKLGVEVIEKPDISAGVSGALIKVGNNFAIAYATHIGSTGFQRFSIGHELGHLCIAGHADALLPEGKAMHESRAGYRTENRYEREADEFSANLLMPKNLFRKSMAASGDGLAAIINLSELCQTSILATAIRYVKLSSEAIAIVVSEGQSICYAFLSNELKEFKNLQWPSPGTPLPSVPTSDFNKERENVVQRLRGEYETPMQDWFGGRHSAALIEEVIGLGKYGRTLTVLTSDLFYEDDDNDQELEDSWTPRL